MTDNIDVTPGSGATVATDDVAGVQFQRVKPTLGDDGVAVFMDGGAGATGAGTQRVTLSSDDPAVASLASILAKIIAAPATEAKQDTIIAALGAAQPAGENHIGQVGGHSAVVTATFNRPADTTAYAVGDLVANSTTAGSVAPMSLAAARVTNGTGLIRRARLSTNKTGLAGTEAFRAHFFKTSPTAANGDNGAFLVNGVAAIHLGYIDIVLDRVFSDGSKGVGAPAVGGEIIFEASSGTANIFALLEARGAYAPNSGETFVLAAEVLRD